MQIYLPIAEMSVNVFVLIGIGGLIGFLSGMFGVGGGFLMTPVLIFIGIPPAVAVATQSNQTVATSVAAVIAHWRRGNVDIAMGVVLLIGGLAGSGLGVLVFRLLQQAGQIDLVIAISYVLFLGVVGVMMAIESVRSIVRARRPGGAPRRKLHKHGWIHGLPLKRRFRRSKLYISVFPPLAIGFLVGILAAIMGVGGGFIMVPAMIYLLGMPTLVVVGTSLFQIIFVTANAAFLHAATNQTVDVLLAGLLLIGSVSGAQIGTRVGSRLPGEQLRAMLAFLVLLVAGKLLFDMIATPDALFEVTWGDI